MTVLMIVELLVVLMALVIGARYGSLALAPYQASAWPFWCSVFSSSRAHLPQT